MSDWHYPRAGLRDQILKTFEDDSVNAYLMFGRRRMGKTRFLLDDMRPAAQKRKWQTLYVDFWEGTSSPAIRLAYALNKGLYATLDDVFPHMKGVTLGNLFSAEFYETKSVGDKAPDPFLALDDLLGAFVNQERKRKTLLLFDEFQQCALHRSSRTFLAQIRASLNKRQGQVFTIFTGSSTTGLEAIFDDRNGPFFDFATPITFDPFGNDFVDHCLEQFKRSTKRTLDRSDLIDAFDALDRVTQNFRELLRLMMHEPALELPDAINRARERFAEDYHFEETWIGLSLFDQVLLRTLTKTNEKLFSKATAETLQSEARLEKRPSRSKVQAALSRLGRQEILIKPRGQNGWLFNDPEFRRWIREHA